MADFTGSLPDPGAIGNQYGLSPPSESLSGTVGKALAGASGLADIALKRMDLEKSTAAKNDLSNKLFDLVEGNGASQDKTVQDTQGQLGKMQASSQQGKMSREELLARSSSLIQQSVNQNPYYADELRSLGKDVLGFQPTAEQAGLVLDQAKWEDQTRNAAKADAVTKAGAAGIQYQNPDGTLNIDKTAQAGLETAAAENQLRMTGNQLDNEIKRIDIAKAYSPPPTESERRDLIETGTLKALNPVFQHNFSSTLDRIPMILKNAGTDEQKKGLILQDLQTTKAQWHAYVQNQFAKMDNLPPTETQNKILASYDNRFDTFTGLVTGPGSTAEGTARALKALQSKTQLDLAKSSPTLFKLKSIFGDNVFASQVGVIIAQDKDLQGQVDTGVHDVVLGAKPHAPGPVETAGLAADLAGGQVHLDQLPNDSYRSSVIQHLGVALNGYYQNPTKLSDQEMSAYGHSISNIAAVGVRLSDRNDVMNASRMTNSAGAVQTFKVFAANPKNAQNVHATAEELLKLQDHNLQMNVPRLVEGGDITVTKQGVIAPVWSTANKVYVQYSAYYNPQTGQIEPLLIAKTPEGQPVPVPPEAMRYGEVKEHMTNIGEMNKSLTAGTAYKSFSLGRMKEWSDQQYRYGAVTAWGMPIKPGTHAPDLPHATPHPNQHVDIDTAKTFVHNILGGTVTSGGRTEAENEAAGGVKNSLHLTNGAVDFHTNLTKEQVRVKLAQAGFPITELLDAHDEKSQHVGHMGPRTIHWGFGPKPKSSS